MIENITDKYVEYLLDKIEGDIPQRVYKQAKICLLDYIGVTFAGASRISEEINNYIKYMATSGNAALIGMDKRCGMLEAAFVNGFNAHVMELDDGHQFGMMHLAAPVISAVLAVADAQNVSFERLLKSIIVGYEAAARLAVSIQPEHKKRGYHTAGTCGTIGAAVGAAYVMGLDKEGIKAAISAAGTSAAGILEIQEDGSLLKPYNTGNAAVSGANAALFALTGFCGPDDILGGERGFSNIFANGSDIDKLVGAEDYFEIERVYLKPYAACRHCHSAIEAAVILKTENNIDITEIEEIIIETYKLAVKGHDHTKIKGASSAKLSIPYSVAVAYILKECGPDAFDNDKLIDEDILTLTNKIKVIENDEFSSLSPAMRIAKVTIKDKKGFSYSKRVDYAKGDPKNPMTMSETEAKFNNLMMLANKENVAKKIVALLKEDIKSANIVKLFELL